MLLFLNGMILGLLSMGSGQTSAAGAWVEWRFSQPERLSDWQPNAEIRELRTDAEGAHFRTVGSDPILELKPLIDIPALPRQAVEIRMKADRDGLMELFWSGTFKGPYGGFSGEKRTPFAVRGDGQWRTYRIFPFWQKEGRILRLRLDPYDGAQFSIASLRVVDAAKDTASPVPPAFDLRRTRVGWEAVHEVRMQPSANGLNLTLRTPDGFALSPSILVDAERHPIVSLRLSSSSIRRASLVFASADLYGLQEYPFSVIADGKEHLYNIDMLNAPGWQGRIVAVGLRPGSRAGDACRLRSLRVAATPQGPPEIRVLSFGVEDALPRAGVPVTVSARTTNAGGQAAREVRPILSLPPGVRATRSPGSAGTALHFGEERVWYWQVIFSRPMEATMSLQIRAANAPPATAKSLERITARPAVAPSKSVPRPQPVRGEYEVGVYYFPGWKSGSQWYPITRFPERRPVLGWYREGDPMVADWHIKWAVEHGITFFVYDWYWSQGARQLEHALLDGYLKSRYRSLLKFCLLWANHNPPKTSSHEDCLAVTRYWIQEYFRQPEYLRVEGKPVLIIFTPHRLREDLGSEAVRRAFDAMREECRQQGLEGLYLIACVGSAGEAREAAREGYDAVSAYNWAGLGVQGSERWASFDALIDGYRRQWQHLAEQSPRPILLPISGGWDSRPWHGDSALVRYGRHPANFRRHLQDAVQFIQAHPASTLPMVLIEAWNEWGEGSYIEPHREFGFGYLDAIRDVFATVGAPHQDLTPVDVAQSVPQVTFALPTQTHWEFSKGVAGWETGMNITDPAVKEGALTFRTTGDDAAIFGPPFQAAAAGWPRVRIRMRLRNTAGELYSDTAQLFWTTRSAAASEATSVRFPVRVDGEWRDYTLPVAQNPRWRGIVTNLRFDPCSRSGVEVQIAVIELRR